MDFSRVKLPFVLLSQIVFLCSCSFVLPREVLIVGNVTSLQSDRPIENAEVVLSNEKIIGKFKVQTDSAGNFSISGPKDKLVLGQEQGGLAEGEQADVFIISVTHPEYVPDEFSEFRVYKIEEQMTIDLGTVYLSSRFDD